jgi:hypothetical protein
MLTTEDYAVLSSAVYNIDALQQNQLDLSSSPDGWTELATVNDTDSGQLAQAFRRNDDIVIAFKGTNSGEGLLDLTL